jgi:hypothetical protein
MTTGFFKKFAFVAGGVSLLALAATSRLAGQAARESRAASSNGNGGDCGKS